MRVKNWEKFQHYKHRDPPWIRLYRGLLNDVEWHNLDGGSAKALVMIWLIASESDGELPSVRDLAFRLRITERQCASVLESLSHWLVQDASTPLAECEQVATPETETETETESLSRAEPRERTRKKLKTGIDQNWEAPSAVLDYARSLKFSESEIAREVAKFKNNAIQNDRRCVDWSAALRNWFLKALEILGREIPQPRSETTTSGVYIMRTDPRFDEWERATGRTYPIGKNGGYMFPSAKPPDASAA